MLKQKISETWYLRTIEIRAEVDRLHMVNCAEFPIAKRFQFLHIRVEISIEMFRLMRIRPDRDDPFA